jgi:hypothetical protein
MMTQSKGDDVSRDTEVGQDTEANLLRQFATNRREIEKVLARADGVADVNDLDRNAMQRLEERVERLIKFFDEWRAIDRQIRETELGRLMQERHEIEERIRDLREEQIRDLRDSE